MFKMGHHYQLMMGKPLDQKSIANAVTAANIITSTSFGTGIVATSSSTDTTRGCTCRLAAKASFVRATYNLGPLVTKATKTTIH